MSRPERAPLREVDLARYVERAFGDIRAALAEEKEPASSALTFTRIGDLIRSNIFLFLEMGLQAQALQPRGPAASGESAWLQRALVMSSVAADLYLGYLVLRRRARSSPHLVRARDWDVQHARGATRLLQTAVTLGGTLIKAGQVASVRGDLLPAAYVNNLATLQDRVPPHPWPVVERSIRRELGRPLASVFVEIEPEAIAAASLAQVHRAWLHDGRMVAVKVQYPEIEGLVEADLVALDVIVSSLASLEPGVRLQPVLDHLRATLPLELDFVREVAALNRLRAALAHRADVLIPGVVPELCTRRLVVMDFVEGVKIDDRAGMIRAGIDPGAAARLLNDVYAEQMLRLGVLHADPHPGNVLVQPGPRLVLLDHGLTIELRPTLVESLAGMLTALLAGDRTQLAQALRGLGFPIHAEADLATLLALAGVLLGGDTPNGGDVGRRLGQVIGDVPLELLTIGRALSMLSGITRQLDPDLDVLEIVARHAERAGG